MTAITPMGWRILAAVEESEAGDREKRPKRKSKTLGGSFTHSAALPSAMRAFQ